MMWPFVRGDVPFVPIDLKRRFFDRVIRMDDGHLGWSGSFHTKRGTPFLYYEYKQIPAAAVAFVLRTGRAPVGYVKCVCEYLQCVSPDCVEDRPGRERLEQQLRDLERKRRDFHAYPDVHGE